MVQSSPYLLESPRLDRRCVKAAREKESNATQATPFIFGACPLDHRRMAP